MRPKRVWMYAFVILMLLSWPCGIQSAIAANKAKSVSTKAPAQASVIKESPSSQSTEESDIFPQLGHKNGINSIAITPDGKYALSGSQDRTIKLWEVSSGREIKTFIGHSNFILSLAISRDGKFALSGSEDSTMKLWNISSGREVRTFTGHTWPIELVAFSLDGKLAYSGSWNNMKIWDIAAGKEIKTVKWNADHVRNIAFSSDGNIAATINSNVLTVWDIKEGKEKWSIKNDDLFDVAISPDGKLVVSTRKEVFTFWDASTGKVKETFTALPREPDWVNKLSFSHDGRYMLSFFGVKGTVKLWDVSTGKTLKELKIPGCSSLTISPDKKYIFSGDQGNDGKIIQWEMLTGKEIKIFRGYVDMVSLATFSPDGRNILSGREKLALWDISTGNRIKSF